MNRVWSRLVWWVASGLGLGLSPVVPGTVGTLLGLPLAWGLARLPLAVQVAAIIVLFASGVPICTQAARDAGGAKDPGWIVWDEVVSFPVVLLGLPCTPTTLAAAFVLHRVFDITKPPPARQLERLPTGLGIMADDMAAAFYAHLVLRAVLMLGLPV